MEEKKEQTKALSDQQKSETLDKLYEKLTEDSKALLQTTAPESETGKNNE